MLESVESFENTVIPSRLVDVLKQTLESEKSLTPRAAKCISQLRSMMETLDDEALTFFRSADRIYWKEEGNSRDIAAEAIENWYLQEVLENHGDSGLQGRLIRANFSIRLMTTH